MTTRTVLRRELSDLKQKVYLLGEQCIEASNLYNSLVETYSDKLQERFNELIKEIKSESKNLNEQCFLVLTLQQPLIRDLRFVMGTLQVVLNLEKIVDGYFSTANLLTDIYLLQESSKNNLTQMLLKVCELIKASLTLYLSSNLELTKLSSQLYSEISYFHDLTYKQVLNDVSKEHGQKAQVEAQMISVIRMAEKISDYALNIIEQVNYIILGNARQAN